MKCYVLTYKYSSARNIINLGDDVQSLAVADMLRQLSVEDEQTAYIPRSEMGIGDPNRQKGILIPAKDGLAWNTYPKSDDLQKQFCYQL